MNFGILGTHFRRSDLSDMEQVIIPKAQWGVLSRQLPDSPLNSLAILQTCNRIEYYFSADDLNAAADWIASTIRRYLPDTPRLPQDILKLITQEEALIHLSRVASGIESMVFGENEILGQVKDTWQYWQDQHSTDPMLNKAFQTAITIGKRVRTETDVSKGAYSVSSIAIEAMRDTILDYFGARILVIGAGTMGLRVVRHVSNLGHPDLTITNRSADKAKALADQFSIPWMPFEQLTEAVSDFDIIFIATASPRYLLGCEMFSNQEKSYAIYDLSVPRNADPRLKTLPNIQLNSVTDLQKVADKNVQGRRASLDRIQLIITDELLKLAEWQRHRAQHLS